MSGSQRRRLRKSHGHKQRVRPITEVGGLDIQISGGGKLVLKGLKVREPAEREQSVAQNLGDVIERGHDLERAVAGDGQANLVATQVTLENMELPASTTIGARTRLAVKNSDVDGVGYIEHAERLVSHSETLTSSVVVDDGEATTVSATRNRTWTKAEEQRHFGALLANGLSKLLWATCTADFDVPEADIADLKLTRGGGWAITVQLRNLDAKFRALLGSQGRVEAYGAAVVEAVRDAIDAKNRYSNEEMGRAWLALHIPFPIGEANRKAILAAGIRTRPWLDVWLIPEGEEPFSVRPR